MENWINFIKDVNNYKNIEYRNLHWIYFPTLYLKWIKKIKKGEKRELNLNINVFLLNIKYINYISLLRKLNSENSKGLNILRKKRVNNYFNILNGSNNRLELFNNLNINKDTKYNLIKSILKNILEEYSVNIESRKIEKNIMTPHYFFTPGYVEKSKPSQIKHWTSSIYNFYKLNKVHVHYLDYYAEKLINSFFNINIIRIKNVWDEKFLLNGFKIIPNNNIIQDMNSLIKYTSTRTSKSFKNIINYPRVFLNYPWFKERIKFSLYMKELIKDRKTLKFGGFFAKKKIELNYSNRTLLSKPLFKHTSSNLIIDLFLYNNKKYLFNKFDHIVWRRTMYKYIYSMSINYIDKINETINRPRFFYINILKPSMYDFYKKIIKGYENLLMLKSKVDFLYLCFFLLGSKYSYYSNIIPKYNTYSILNWIRSKKKEEKIYFYISKLALIEREFYIINKDIINSKEADSNLDLYKNDVVNYCNSINDIKDKILLEGNKDNKKIDLYIWRSFFNNKKQNVTKYIFKYNEKLFKPYYRYMIPMFILESYKSFLSNLGYSNIIIFFKKKIFFSNEKNLKWFNINNNILFNFIIVKVLLDLLKYNYRSLLKIKPKYYYINKLRFYESKIRRLKFNTWLSAIKYLKRLRKTPRNFWKRYHKLVAHYYGRVLQNAELDTERKIFIPFLIYFENILYTVYNKPVIIRLWPLKRYYLSSVILVKRIITTILIRQHKISLGGYRKVIRKLMSTFRALEIKKAYDYYISNNSRWPTNLVNILGIEKSKYSIKYENLEYFSKEKDKYNFLNTYFIKNYDLSNFISNIKNNYTQVFIKNLSVLKTRGKKQIIRSFKKSNISLLNYTYYWIKPFKNYIMQMRRNLDISGIKFRIGGRSGIRRSNIRKFKKIKYYGNLMGPIHSSMKTQKNVSLYNPQLIGHIKSNIDYSFGWGITRNGCLSLKIWISSLFSVDLRELILHLIRIQNLYYYLVNRYYLVEKNFISINNYYLKPVNSKINEYNNEKKN